MKSFVASATLVGIYALGVAAQPTASCESYNTQGGCPAVYDPCCPFICTSPEGITSCVKSYAIEGNSGIVCSACPRPSPGLKATVSPNRGAQKATPQATPKAATCESYDTQGGCPAVYDPCCPFVCTSPEGITSCVKSYAIEGNSGIVCKACPSAKLSPLARRDTAAPTAVQTSGSSSAATEAPSSSSAPTKAGGASSSAPAAASTGNLSTSAPSAPKETKDRKSGAAAGIYMMSFGTSFGLGLLCAGLVL